MNIQLPDPASFGGVVLAGWTANAARQEQQTGTVIVKAAYDLAGADGSAKSMVRSSNSGRFAISFADIIIPATKDKGTPLDTSDDETFLYGLEREADVALQKDRADIVVKGLGGVQVAGEIRVDGALWFARTSAASGVSDTKANLFGWHARSESNRRIDENPAAVPAPSHLPERYLPEYNNFFRRSAGFSAIAVGQAKALPSDKLVRITRTPNAANWPYEMRLPDLALKARLRCWCGDCEDKPGHWSIRETIPLIPDTLIVEPAANKAEIIWRGRFDWDEPGELPNTRKPIEWRLAQVMEGAV